LAILNLGGAAAENLLLGTALTESGLTYLKQAPNGPALGVYQCEPATHEDLWTNFIVHHEPFMLAVHGLATPQFRADQLVSNLAYATAICRLHYYRSPEPLPAADDAAGLAQMHKLVYNTMLGATDPAVSIHNFERAIQA
jgi:hypothetical protein